MTGREIRKALHEGQRVFATAVTAPSPRWPDLVRKGGADFVFIDSEHTPLGREILSWMCQGFTAVGVPPVVRVPSPELYEASKVLDGGASGVIGPYIETVEQVRGLVGAARWRPLKGQRMQDAIFDSGVLDSALRDYLEERNRDTILILNIESVPALNRLDELLAVPGVDAVLIGPHDLSCSLGIPEQYHDPRFDDAVRFIFRTARARGLGAGIHYWLGLEEEVAWAQAGGNLVMHSSDIALFGQGLERDLKALRSALKETSP